MSANIFKIIISIIGIVVIAFNVLLYNFCERQKAELNSMKDKQDVEVEFNSNKFKYQQDQIERTNRDLEEARQQIKEQKDALANQAEESKSIETSLVDIKAEADAIKQDMKGWQKDYVSILAELNKKMDDSKSDIKGVKDDLDSFEKSIRLPDNGLSGNPPAAQKKIEPSESK